MKKLRLPNKKRGNILTYQSIREGPTIDAWETDWYFSYLYYQHKLNDNEKL